MALQPSLVEVGHIQRRPGFACRLSRAFPLSLREQTSAKGRCSSTWSKVAESGGCCWRREDWPTGCGGCAPAPWRTISLTQLEPATPQLPQQKRARHGRATGLASTKRGPCPQPSEGQQRLQLGICRRRRLLRLTLSEQIIQ